MIIYWPKLNHLFFHLVATLAPDFPKEAEGLENRNLLCALQKAFSLGNQ
jgi:hypothetical protein